MSAIQIIIRIKSIRYDFAQTASKVRRYQEIDSRKKQAKPIARPERVEDEGNAHGLVQDCIYPQF